MQVAPPTTVHPVQRGDWPFSSEPPRAIGQTQRRLVLQAIVDREPEQFNGARLDTPDEVGQRLMAMIGHVAEAGSIMQRGIESHPTAFVQASQGAAQLAASTMTGLHAWLHPDLAKVRVMQRLDETTSRLVELAERWTADPDAHGGTSAHDLGRVIVETDLAAQDALALLAQPHKVRQSPRL